MSACSRSRKEQGNGTDCFCWLLTALGAPAFVRLYVEPCQTGKTDHSVECWPLRIYEDAFFSLAPTILHPEEGRTKAWEKLKQAIASDPHRQDARQRYLTKGPESSVGLDIFDSRLTPAEFFAVALRCVLAEWNSTAANPRQRSEYREVASSGGACDLLPNSDRPTPADSQAVGTDGYVEVHVHKDGCVPYEWLWQQWMTGDLLRPRANIDYPIEQSTVDRYLGMGTWKTTYAELLSNAAHCRKYLLKFFSSQPSDGNDAALRGQLIEHVERTHSPLTESVAYLSIYIGIRRSMAFDRSVSGLAGFSTFFGKVGDLRRPRAHPARSFVRQQVEASLQRFYQEGADAVELRPMLSRNAITLRETLDDLIAGYFEFLESVRDAPRPRFGIVFSLRKDPQFEKGADLANPEVWTTQVQQWETQVETLLTLLCENALYRYFVVGIDAAGQEQGCPPRALSKALQQIRTYNKGQSSLPVGRHMTNEDLEKMVKAHQKSNKLEDVAELLRRWSVAPIRLGITIHAGEDFVDPMTGLRHIWETLHHLGLREGDRIGHALAAALAPEALKDLLTRRYSQSDAAPVKQPRGARWRLHKPRGVHLLDLAWEWRMHNEASASPKAKEKSPTIEQQLVEAQLRSAAMSAHGSPVNSERFLAAIDGDEHPVRLLLPAVHFKDPAFLEPEDREWVILDDQWLNRFEHMRQQVLRTLRARKIAVESCPTSNQRIGNLSESPLRHLHRELPELTLIATDDPGLFDAWPQHELAKFSTDERKQLLENNRKHSFIRF